MARYQIIRKLATGGMAEVFLGRAIGSGGFQKPVAIKRILGHLGADKEFVTRFHDEARLTVHLQHANVVQVFDLGQTASDHLMVLEFVDGDTLRAVLRESKLKGVPLPLREMIFVIQQVTEGLAYAHEVMGPDRKSLNIIHRDINPANVMVSVAGEVKLADFGIARAAMAQSNTATGVVRGKVGYFAPEVARGMDADQRSDVFLMGLMLYEVLAQKRLFKETDFVKSLVEVGHFDIATVLRPENVPPPLWEIVAASLHQDPNQRTHSARELSLKLASYLFENRLRVGPTDVAQLFAKLFPERRSPLHDLDASTPVSEVNLAGDSATPAHTPAGGLATRTGVLPAPPVDTDFVPPPSRPQAPIPKGSQTGTPAPSRPGARVKARLGELLLLRKLITLEQLDQALQMQKRVGGQLGDVLVSLNHLSEDDLYATLAEQKGFRYVRTSKLEGFEMSGYLKTLVPREVAERLHVLPLSLDEKRTLFLAMKNPADIAALDEVRLRADVPRVTGVMIRPQTLEKMLERAYLGRNVDLELPAWVNEQAQMLERFGATSSDQVTKSREQLFGETELKGDAPQADHTRVEAVHAGAQAPSVLDLFVAAAAAREDPLGRQAMRLLHLVRGVCVRLSLDAAATTAVERQAIALFMAGQLEHRRFFEPPGLVTVKQLLAGFPPAEDAYTIWAAEQHATAKLLTVPQQVLAGVFTLGQRVQDLDAPGATCAAALVEMQTAGRIPGPVISALSQQVQSQPPAVVVIAAPGSALFAVVPALARLGHRVVAARADCFERFKPAKAIIDATLQAPPALELVQHAVKVGAKVAAVAPPNVVPIIAPWKSAAVTVMSSEDLRTVVSWVRQQQ